MSQSSITEYFSPLVWAAVGVNVFWRVGVSSLLKCYLADFHVERFNSEWGKKNS